MAKKLTIIGGGLAGSEAAWQAAQKGIQVTLMEMRPSPKAPAHKTGNLAELVCSNSLRSDDKELNAVGVLHEELRICSSLLMQCADETKVPAGGALAVDREAFAKAVEAKISSHPLITIVRKEAEQIPEGSVIIASGPLTSETLTAKIQELTGEDSLHFFDAIAPVVYTESVDMSKA